jgi:hypothetical protein
MLHNPLKGLYLKSDMEGEAIQAKDRDVGS